MYFPFTAGTVNCTWKYVICSQYTAVNATQFCYSSYSLEYMLICLIVSNVQLYRSYPLALPLHRLEASSHVIKDTLVKTS